MSEHSLNGYSEQDSQNLNEREREREIQENPNVGTQLHICFKAIIRHNACRICTLQLTATPKHKFQTTKVYNMLQAIILNFENLSMKHFSNTLKVNVGYVIQ